MDDPQTIKVLGFAGSLRKGSYNRMALRAAEELLPDGMTLAIFDVIERDTTAAVSATHSSSVFFKEREREKHDHQRRNDLTERDRRQPVSSQQQNDEADDALPCFERGAPTRSDNAVNQPIQGDVAVRFVEKRDIHDVAKQVSVCGEMAGDPAEAILLLGM